MEGKFITFEGIDGSGKTSVLKGVTEHLNDKRIDNYIWTREPGGNRISEAIRKIILNVEYTEMDARTEALLYAAARRQHLVDTVLPALNEGKLVLCDRFVDSSVVYQGVARDIGVEPVIKLNEFATENLKPDLTLYYDVEPEISLKRISNNRQNQVDRLDKESMDFYHKVRQAYLSLAESNKERIKVIDASQNLDKVIDDTLSILNNFM
ncbi:dTMP kinase [Ligilactobacillus salivarius]|uniref:dTMP kinase n=1 Tax=Ligilactobacillus salivarius TaxID=1624 RepID=UPI0009DB6D1D|nr:dTMP kinase [Ligilactobacillus salivarius]OQQ87809.1 dTMP kinase [Ligilactobacillus salivarius]